MKNKKWLVLLSLVVVSLFFVSACSNGDDNSTPRKPALTQKQRFENKLIGGHWEFRMAQDPIKNYEKATLKGGSYSEGEMFLDSQDDAQKQGNSYGNKAPGEKADLKLGESTITKLKLYKNGNAKDDRGLYESWRITNDKPNKNNYWVLELQPKDPSTTFKGKIYVENSKIKGHDNLLFANLQDKNFKKNRMTTESMVLVKFDK